MEPYASEIYADSSAVHRIDVRLMAVNSLWDTERYRREVHPCKEKMTVVRDLEKTGHHPLVNVGYSDRPRHGISYMGRFLPRSSTYSATTKVRRLESSRFSMAKSAAALRKACVLGAAGLSVEGRGETQRCAETVQCPRLLEPIL